MKRKLVTLAFFVASLLVGAAGGLLIAIGFEKIGTVGMVGILGALAGMASLAWQVRDRVLWVPKVTVTAELVYTDEKPTKIRHITNNTGKPTDIIHWGFASADRRIIYCMHTGLIPHIARKKVPLESDFDINETIMCAQKKNCSIRLVFAEDDRGVYVGEIPENMLIVLDRIAANSGLGRNQDK